MTRGIFLDRDGVINEVLTDRVKFVNKPADLFLLEGAGEAIKLFNDLGFSVFVITNQGGIGLGYMTETQLVSIHEKLLADLAGFGATIDDIAYCPHKPHDDCSCRKPNPKMILDLADQYQIDLSKSYMAGDRKPDIEAGRRAGTNTILISNNKQLDTIQADCLFLNLLSFAQWLQEK